MIERALLAIVQNTALLLAAALIFHVSRIPWQERKMPFYGAHLGVILGVIGIAIMASAWVQPPGFLIDTRSILLALSGLFFGAVPTVIAMAITTLYQIQVGGPGMAMGIFTILSSGMIGIGWRAIRKRPLAEISFREILTFGFIVHAVYFLSVLTLSLETAFEVLKIILIPGLILFPAATARLGLLLTNRLRQEAVIQKLKEDEEKLRTLTDHLKTSEQHYRLLTENIKDVVWVFDVDEMSFVFVSPSIQHLLGFSPEECMARQVSDFLLKKERKHGMKLIEDRTIDFRSGKFSSDVYFTDELEQSRKDGTTVWTELVTGFYQNPVNGHVEVRGVTHDISERRAAEENLRRQDQLYHAIIENAPDGVAIIDLKGNFTFASPSAKKMFGYSEDEEISVSSSDSTHPDDLPLVLETFSKAITNPAETATIQYRFRCKDGTWRWIESTFSSIFPGSGKQEIVINFRDITERKFAEDALRESERKFRQIFENTTTGISLLNSRGQFLSGNPAILKLLGYSEDEYSCLSIEDITHPDDLLKNKIPFQELWEGKRNYFSIEKRDIARNGDIVWGQLTCTIVRDRDGYPQYAIGMFENIGDRKRAEEKVIADQSELQRLLLATEQSRRALLSMVEDQKMAEEKIHQLNLELEQRVRDRTAQLQTANRELEAFSYSVSHDLRAPLRALDGFSSILLGEYGNVLDEKGRHYLNRVQEATRKMGQLINDLLSLSRVTRTEFIRQNVDLSEVALEIVADLKSQEPERDIEFCIAPGMEVQGDIQLLKIALSNLLSNAVKFTKQRKKAKITIGVEDHTGERVFFIRDNGAGFDMNYAEKLFVPFQRLHSASEFPGTGIGLVIVQRIITRHGGRIWPEARLNKGATFFFTLGGVL